MKNSLLKCLILFFGLLLIFNPLYAQSKFEVAAGLGVPEFMTVKAKYGHKLQVGLCIGGYASQGFFGSKEVFLQGSVSGEIYYHFLGKSKFTEQPPWYILAGLGYYDIGMVDYYGIYRTAFYPRIGRSLNFSKRCGLNLDFGAFIPLSMNSSFATYKFKILGSGSVGLFVRL